ncbi:hypothetical protein ABK040_007060 [Willaertia magna]
MTSDFIDIHEIENIFSKECELYYFTKNKQAFQLILGNLKSIPLFCKQSTTIINNENNENMTTNKEKIINAVYSFGEKSFLTTNKVYISNKEIELPKIDVDDKLIKLIVNDNKTSAFLLTEKGQLFIYGENQYGILGIGKSGYVYSKFTKHVIQKEIKNKIIDLKCGYLFSVLRCENGDCYGSGYNYYVNIGIIGPNTGELNKFTLLEQLKGKVKQHDCGYFHTAYLTFDGEVYITGKQDNGQFVKKIKSEKKMQKLFIFIIIFIIIASSGWIVVVLSEKEQQQQLLLSIMDTDDKNEILQNSKILLKHYNIYLQNKKMEKRNFFKQYLSQLLKEGKSLPNTFTKSFTNSFTKSFTKIKSPLYTKLLQNKIYSSHQSINTHLSIKDLTPSNWKFKNICINKKGEFIYFLNPLLQNLQTTQNFYKNYENSQTNQITFTTLVQTTRRGIRGIFGKDENLKFKIKIGKIPEKVKFIEKTVLATNRYANGNVGHVIIDNLVPWLDLILKFGESPTKTHILFLDEINYPIENCKVIDESDNVGFTKNLCKEYQSSFLYSYNQTVINSLQWTFTMTTQPILQKCSYKILQENNLENNNLENTLQQNNNLQNKFIYSIEQAPCPRDDFFTKTSRKTHITLQSTNQNQIENQIENEIDICFKTLLLGNGDRSYVPFKENARFRELPILNFRKLIFKNLNILQKEKTKNKLIIAIHNKPLQSTKHGNAIYNINEIITRLQIDLQKKLKKLNIKKEIIVIGVTLEKLNLLQQIEFFTEVDIYLSTVGSGSLYSIFMPNKSFLLYAPECKRFGILKHEFHCFHEVIHVVTAMPHLNVIDVKYTVKDCISVGLSENKNENCNLVLDYELIKSEMIQAVNQRLGIYSQKDII